MDADKVRSVLNGFDGFHEVAEVHTFTAYRDTPDSGEEKVTVAIRDYGEEFEAGRYSCLVTTEDGRQATGNLADDLQVLLSIVHWGDLDAR